MVREQSVQQPNEPINEQQIHNEDDLYWNITKHVARRKKTNPGKGGNRGYVINDHLETHISNKPKVQEEPRTSKEDMEAKESGNDQMVHTGTNLANQQQPKMVNSIDN